MPKPKIKKKIAPKITPRAEARIVDLSLQHPEFGAKRLLPLLNSEGIGVSVSTVYNILKRNGLQNHVKRLARIKAPQAVAEPLPHGSAIPPQSAVQAPMPEDQSAPISKHAVEKAKPTRGLPIPSITQRAVTGRPWYITLINSGLVFLIVLLGFHTWHNVSQARLEPEFVASTPPPREIDVLKPAAAPAPLRDYRMISKRNLFNVSKSEKPSPQKAIPVEKLAPAQKELGLQLVGTVVAFDTRLSRAFIDNRRTREQEIYKEGDKANEVLIKKILRNRVIIASKEGDRLLTVDLRGTSGPPNPTSYEQQKMAGGEYPQQIAGGRRPGRSIALAREEIEASLADIGELVQQLKIEPFEKDYQPAGFTISGIPPQSILRKIGLKNGNTIMGVNDMAITSPDQATEFFQKLAEGGEKTIKVKIGRGVRRRTRWLHLNIE